MSRNVMYAGVLFAFLGAFSLQSQSTPVPEPSHSGGTDKCGCHFNRKTGEYHCHKRKQRGGDCPD